MLLGKLNVFPPCTNNTKRNPVCYYSSWSLYHSLQWKYSSDLGNIRNPKGGCLGKWKLGWFRSTRARGSARGCGSGGNSSSPNPNRSRNSYIILPLSHVCNMHRNAVLKWFLGLRHSQTWFPPGPLGANLCTTWRNRFILLEVSWRQRW